MSARDAIRAREDAKKPPPPKPRPKTAKEPEPEREMVNEEPGDGES